MLTGIIWSNLAMAVVPERRGAGQSSTSRPTPARRSSPAPTAIRTISTSPTRTTISTRRRASTPTTGLQEDLHPRAELSGRQGRADRLQALLQGRARRRDLHQARPDRLRRRDRPDPRLRRRHGLLLPARRHGHRLHEAVRPVGRRHAGDRPGLLLQPGHPAARSARPRSACRTPPWSPDLDNEANKDFVEAFKAEYNRLPSIYASQGYDTANLILSALAKASVEGRGRLPCGAQGGRLPDRCAASSSSAPTTTRSRTSTSARW